MSTVAIRVDSSRVSGMGHVIRCLSLAAELRRWGASVVFICRDHVGNVMGRLEDNGFEVLRLPRTTTGTISDPRQWLGADQGTDAAETLNLLTGRTVNCLVVDHYAIGVEWQRAMRPAAGKLVVIDDLADRPHDADLVIDHNCHGAPTASRYENLVGAGSKRLLGPRYALLQSEYAMMHRVLPPRSGAIARIAVFVGGSDPADLTSLAIDALDCSELRSVAVDVVVGPSHPNPAAVALRAAGRPGTRVIDGLPSLAGLWARADLGIGAGGGAALERLCLGLPSVVTTIAENQEPGTRILALEGGLAHIPAASMTAEALRDQVIRMASAPALLAAMAKRGMAMVDGLGTRRVAAAMIGISDQPVHVRAAVRADEGLMLDWANDPETRRQAFNTDTISAQDHHRWYEAKLLDPSSVIVIGETVLGLPVGQVRFDGCADSGTATVSVSVEPAVRGSGVGRRLLDAAIGAFARMRPTCGMVADVKPGNEASLRLFEGAGFTETAPRTPAGRSFVRAGHARAERGRDT